MRNLSLTAVIPIKNLDSSTYAMSGVVEEAINNKIEIKIVVNNKDREESFNISEFFSKLSKENLEVLVSDFESPGNARNLGLNACSTKYVTFWDSDDLPIIPKVRELGESILEQPQVNFGVGSFLVASSQTGEILSEHICPEESGFESYIVRNPGIWRWIFSVHRIGSVRFQNFPMGEDQDFIADINPKIEEIINSQEVTYIYQKGWPNQLTQTPSSINRILDSIVYMINQASNDSGNIWRMKLLHRQVLTGLRRASWSIKFVILGKLCSLVKLHVRK